jgi:hypothetical protein
MEGGKSSSALISVPGYRSGRWGQKTPVKTSHSPDRTWTAKGAHPVGKHDQATTTPMDDGHLPGSSQRGVDARPHLNQSSQPDVVTLMLDALVTQTGMRVLESAPGPVTTPPCSPTASVPTL